MMNEIISFGEWVRRRRKTLDLTRAGLADLVGCSTDMIKKIERDERRPSLQLAELLSRHMQIPKEEADHFLKMARGTYMPRLCSPMEMPESKAISVNVPKHSAVLLGREREVEHLTQSLTDPGTRLITLIGPGGVGKTRLAAQLGELASELGLLRHQFSDGVSFVPLASAASPDDLLSAIGDAVNFSFPDEQPAQFQLISFLAEKHLLLILDNFESVIEHAALIATMLEGAPHMQVVATSRERLRLRQEQVYALQPLPVPIVYAKSESFDAPAVALFKQRAQLMRPGFEITRENIDAVLEICRLVDGLPLAIELAAGWAGLLSAEEIVSAIQQDLDFLRSELLDVQDRHRSIRAVFNQSWRQLDAAQRDGYMRLSVFRDGFSAEAAARVAGMTLSSLATLADKSLLRRDWESGRFELHSLLRQHAAGQLLSYPKILSHISNEHATYYCEQLGTWSQMLRRSEHEDAVRAIEAEIANIHAAWFYAIEHQQARNVVRAVDGMGEFFSSTNRWYRGLEVFKQSTEALQSVLGEADHQPMEVLALAKISAWYGLFQWIVPRSMQIDTSHGEALTRQSLELLSDPRLAETDTRQERAFVLQLLGRMTLGTGRGDRIGVTKELLSESLSLYREIGDTPSIADVTYELNFPISLSGEHAQANRLLTDSIALYRELGDQRRLIRSLVALGWNARQALEHEAAQRHFASAYDIAQREGDRWWMADTLGHMAYLATWIGDFDTSIQCLLRSVELWRDIGHQSTLALHQCTLGEAYWRQGQMQQGYTTLEAALEMQKALGNGHAGAAKALVEADIHAGRYAEAQAMMTVHLSTAESAFTDEMLARIDLATGQSAGACARYQQVLDEIRVRSDWWARRSTARVQAFMGCALVGLKQFEEARQCLVAALETSLATRAFSPLQYAIAFAPCLLAGLGRVEYAVDLYALATGHRFLADSAFYDDCVGRHLRASIGNDPPLTTVVPSVGSEVDWWSSGEHLLRDLRIFDQHSRKW